MLRSKRRLVAILLLLALAGTALVARRWLVASNYHITLAALESVEAGMSVAQVESLFGGPARDYVTDPFIFNGVANNVTVDDYSDGTSAKIGSMSRVSGISATRGATARDWNRWRAPQGKNTFTAAVYFDAQGGAQKVVSYEFVEPGFLARLRSWLGF
jgi:outer membrane protein assembly factor BamE (lipoprotein component of BamABCDE complex)